MRIGITDSGTGGLSVCAEVEARLRDKPCSEDIEILYLNAAFRDDHSYNALDSRREKLEAFDLFLANVAGRYLPDLLYIACNSLSVLYEDSFFDHHREESLIEGIVATGAREILASLDGSPDRAVAVFATPTTVAEGSYPRRLAEAGIDPARVVQQACPGLPDAISNDFSGTQAEALLRTYVPEALKSFDSPPAAVNAYLGCTHYGYQAPLFERLLEEHLQTVRIIDPNRSAAEDIIGKLSGPDGSAGSGGLEIRFVTPYAIPGKPLKSLTHYLGGKAPKTVAALHEFAVDDRLYRA